MEIERKYLITALPANFTSYPFHRIEQAYLCTSPVVRIRYESGVSPLIESADSTSPPLLHSEEMWYLTYKGKGMMAREEYNLPLTEEAYAHLLTKADGNILTKTRYLIPMEGTHFTIELDIFEGKLKGLMLAEVEFKTEDEANQFVPPAWFGTDVTFTGEYQNSQLSQMMESSTDVRCRLQLTVSGKEE